MEASFDFPQAEPEVESIICFEIRAIDNGEDFRPMHYLYLGEENLSWIDMGAVDGTVGYIDGIDDDLEAVLADAGLLDKVWKAGADYLRQDTAIKIVTNPDGLWV